MRQVFCRFEQGAALLQKVPAGRRQSSAMSGAVVDGHVQVFFQFLHGVADGGGNPEQFVSGPGETAFAVNGVKDFEGVYGDGCMHVRII